MIPNWITQLLAKARSWRAKRREAREIARMQERFFDNLEERDMDEDENAATQPPPDESINLLCLWVVEFYGPSQIPNLINGSTQLGWAKRASEHRESAVEYMQKARERGDTGSWMSLGTIRKPGDNRFWEDSIRADLPRGVDLAIGTMHQVLPSVTAVAMQFVFDEVTNKCLQEVLQETYATELRPIPGSRGRQYMTPRAHKAERLALARASLRSRCEFWFNKYLPGVFSARPFPTRFPACELVTLSKGVPFIDSEERRGYIELLGLDRTWDAWRCEKIPALKLGWRSFQPTGTDYLMMAANEGELAVWAAEHEGYAEIPKLLATSQLGLDRWLVGWSLRGLLEQHSKSILALRDNALHDATASWFSKALRKTQKELLQLRPDVVSFAEDMSSMKKSGELFRMGEHKFETLSPRGRSNRELLELVLEQASEESERLNQGMRSVTDDFMTSVSLRHQAALTLYTLVIVVLTVVLVILELVRRQQ